MIDRVQKAYPNASGFATTLREVISANHHLWGAIIGGRPVARGRAARDHRARPHRRRRRLRRRHCSTPSCAAGSRRSGSSSAGPAAPWPRPPDRLRPACRRGPGLEHLEGQRPGAPLTPVELVASVELVALVELVETRAPPWSRPRVGRARRDPRLSSPVALVELVETPRRSSPSRWSSSSRPPPWSGSARWSSSSRPPLRPTRSAQPTSPRMDPARRATAPGGAGTGCAGVGVRRRVRG